MGCRAVCPGVLPVKSFILGVPKAAFLILLLCGSFYSTQTWASTSNTQVCPPFLYCKSARRLSILDVLPLRIHHLLFAQVHLPTAWQATSQAGGQTTHLGVFSCCPFNDSDRWPATPPNVFRRTGRWRQGGRGAFRKRR